MHKKIIEHFQGHFRLSECNEKLVDVFCKSVVTELSIEALEKHIQSDQHKNALDRFQLKERLKGRSRKVAADLDQLAKELHENAQSQEEDISDDFMDSFIKIKSLPDKVN